VACASGSVTYKKNQLRLMLVITLNWETSINPVLLTVSIVTHIGVTQRRQFTGSVL
jgi:hypothetical protein